MGKLEDPNFLYVNSTESNKPGYLERRMEIYKEMVKHEQGRAIHPKQEDRSIGQRYHGAFLGEQEHSKPNTQFFVVGGKG